MIPSIFGLILDPYLGVYPLTYGLYNFGSPFRMSSSTCGINNFKTIPWDDPVHLWTMILDNLSTNGQ